MQRHIIDLHRANAQPSRTANIIKSFDSPELSVLGIVILLLFFHSILTQSNEGLSATAGVNTVGLVAVQLADGITKSSAISGVLSPTTFVLGLEGSFRTFSQRSISGGIGS